MMNQTSLLVHAVIRAEIHKRLNLIKNFSEISFNGNAVEEIINFYIARAKSLSITNNVVLDSDDNRIVDKIVGSIMDQIFELKMNELPTP